MQARVVLCAALLPLISSELPAQEPADRAPTILVTGRVVEHGTGAAVPAAMVVLPGHDLTQTTDGQGLFQFLHVRPGTHRLRVEHIGYGTLEETLEVPDRGRIELEIRLVREPVEIEPVLVAVERAGGTALRGFYERRRTGLGTYLTRTDLEEPAVSEVSDVLRRVPGLRLVPRTAGGLTVGHDVRFRGNCRPTLFVDGVIVDTRTTSIDEILHPNDVEAVEIYRGAVTPVVFTRGAGSCGALVIWTRTPGGSGTLPFWKGALFGGLFALLALLLTS